MGKSAGEGKGEGDREGNPTRAEEEVGGSSSGDGSSSDGGCGANGDGSENATYLTYETLPNCLTWRAMSNKSRVFIPFTPHVPFRLSCALPHDLHLNWLTKHWQHNFACGDLNCIFACSLNGIEWNW